MVKRKSNFELLRIVSMLMIIMFHYVYKGNFIYPEGFSTNKLLLKSFWMLGEAGVNLFVLISGYFMVNGTFQTKKLILLIAQVLFYHFFMLVFLSFAGAYTFPAATRDRLLLCFPIVKSDYWFVTAYLLLYIFSPYLNTLIHALTRQSCKKLLLILLTVYSVIPTFFGIFYDTTESLLFYSRFIWLVVMYLAGAYIRLYFCTFLNTMKKACLLTAGSLLAMIASICFFEVFHEYFAYLGTTESAYFWPPNTILMVTLSLGIFGIFRQLRIPDNPVINALASTTLGVYLLHDGNHSWWIWKQFDNASHQYSPCLVLYIIRDACIVFFAAAAFDLVRQFLERHTLKRLLDAKPIREFLDKLDH